MQLKRTLGTWSLLFAAIAGILGSGWLFGPYYAAQVAGPSAILAWIFGGVLMVVIAMTFAELASTFPLAGGSVRFMQLSHGPLVSFTMAWIAWISSVAVAPIETLALLQYTTNYVPWLMHSVNNTYVLSGPGLIVAAILLLVMSAINVMGVRFLAKTNNAVVFFKLLVPALTIILLLSLRFNPSNFVSYGFMPLGLRGILHALPTAGVIFSFIGYSPAIQLAGEAKDPQRSIPIAIIGALLICMAFYVLLQITFIGVLRPADFSQGWNHLTFSYDAGPFTGIMISLGLAWMAYLIYFGAMVSPFGTALIFTGSSARMCYAMGENGYLPQFLHRLNIQGTPGRIIALNFVMGLLLFLPFPTWRSMVSFLVSAFVFTYAVGPLALIVLRQTLPHQPRPFRVPAARAMCLLAFYVGNLIIFWTGWDILWKMFVTLGLGYIYFVGFLQTTRGKKLELEWRKAWWIFIYIIALGIVSYLGTFGNGIGVIPFGWDFLVIAVLSFIVYELALWSGLRADKGESLVKNISVIS